MNTSNNDDGRLNRQVDDLSMLVKRLVHQLKKYEKNNVVAQKAMDYLQKEQLEGEALR